MPPRLGKDVVASPYFMPRVITPLLPRPSRGLLSQSVGCHDHSRRLPRVDIKYTSKEQDDSYSWSGLAVISRDPWVVVTCRHIRRPFSVSLILGKRVTISHTHCVAIYGCRKSRGLTSGLLPTKPSYFSEIFLMDTAWIVSNRKEWVEDKFKKHGVHSSIVPYLLFAERRPPMIWTAVPISEVNTTRFTCYMMVHDDVI